MDPAPILRAALPRGGYRFTCAKTGDVLRGRATRAYDFAIGTLAADGSVESVGSFHSGAHAARKALAAFQRQADSYRASLTEAGRADRLAQWLKIEQGNEAYYTRERAKGPTDYMGKPHPAPRTDAEVQARAQSCAEGDADNARKRLAWLERATIIPISDKPTT